jgi:GNAT superfamily N-acetyltransferase
MMTSSSIDCPVQRSAEPKAIRAEYSDIESMRTLYGQEMNCQIVHDSIHTRPGWTVEYLLGTTAPCGYGSVAVGGPWKDKPTFYEFYVLPQHQLRAFECFEAFLAASRARFFEVQTNDPLSTVMALTYGRDPGTEKILFQDRRKSALAANGAMLRRVTSGSEIQAAMKLRQGGGEWLLELDGAVAGKGGILFHYNEPYGDIYMEVTEPFRRRGLGAYFVQELKRECRELGAIPSARCNPTNVASRRTLQRAGFVPVAHILTGSFTSRVGGHQSAHDQL